MRKRESYRDIRSPGETLGAEDIEPKTHKHESLEEDQNTEKPGDITGVLSI